MSALKLAAPTRAAAVTIAVFLAALLAFAGQAAAADQPANMTFNTSSPTPGSGFGFGLYNYAIAHDDTGNFPFAPGDKRGHCVQETVLAFDGPAILKTDGDVALNPPPDGVTAADQANRIAWLLLSSLYNQDNAEASSLTLTQRADAHQSAIWHMTDAGNPKIVSSDAATAEETTRLLAASDVNKAAAQQAPSMVATGAVTCNGGTRGVSVAGAPFGTAELTITSPNGTFPGGAKSASLDLGPTGAASTTVTGGVGAVAISAIVPQAKLVQADFEETQDLVYTETTGVPVQLAIDFPPCATPVAPAPAPAIPAAVPPITQVAAAAPRTRLQVIKRGPKRARAGSRIRFTIIIRNRTRVVARNVVVTDRLPRGMVLAKRNKGLRINGRNLSIRVGSIGPKRTIRRTVTVNVLRSSRGRRCNVATANASNANRVRARACTRVIRVVRKIAPAVTG